MKGYNTLLLGSVASKVLTLVVFIILARSLKPEELALIALFPSVAMVVFSAATMGIVTSMEREIPKLLLLKRDRAEVILSDCIKVILFLILISLFVICFSFPVFYDLVDNKELYILGGYFLIPVCMFMVLHMTSIIFKLEGELSLYWVVRFLSDIVAKICAVVAYWFDSSLGALFVGLFIGYLPFVLCSLFFLIKKALVRSEGVIHSFKEIEVSYIYYVESLFNTARIYGDPIIISFVLNPVMVGAYYVVKRVPDQMETLFQPIQTMVTTLFSREFSKGDESFRGFVFDVSAVGEFFIYVGVTIALLAPVLLYVVGGALYFEFVISAVFLCISLSGLHVNSILGRVVLFVGAKYSRLFLSLSQFFVFIVLALPMSESWGIDGYAGAFFISQVCTFLMTMVVLSYYGFTNLNISRMFFLLFVGFVVVLVNTYSYIEFGLGSVALLLNSVLVVMYAIVYLLVGSEYVFSSVLPSSIGNSVLKVKNKALLVFNPSRNGKDG